MGFFDDLFIAKDRKPLSVAVILQRDSDSRLLGDFGEKEIKNAAQFAIVERTLKGELKVMPSSALNPQQTVLLLMQAALLVANDIGK